jgi:hypothetical protein
MIGDAFVFDGVAHPFNFDESNAHDGAGDAFRRHLYAFHQVLTPEGEPVLSEDEFLREWSVDEIYEMVFDQSDTDRPRGHATAADRHVQGRVVAVGEVRRAGPEGPRPDLLLGNGQPARGA